MRINIDNDKSRLTEGVWTKFGESEFLVAHMSSLPFQRAVMRRQAPYRRKIEQGSLDPGISRDLMTHAMAEELVKDWKQVVDGEGKEIPFTAEACYRALSNNEDLRDFISEFTMSLDNFKEEERKELVKS